MRLLLDESVPHPLIDSLSPHEVETAQSMGWSGVDNGELLRRGAASGFDAFLTVDRGFQHQQNLAELPLTVAIVRGRSNRLEDLVPLVPALLASLESATAGSLVVVGP